MTLQLPVELERSLEAVARKRGLTVDLLALQLLASAIEGMAPAVPARRDSGPIGEAFFEALRQLPGSIVDSPGEIFDRAMIYEDHD